ncbi:type II secretion system protein [Clostridium sp. KNHs214]|uniref:pilus assembly FimT family protein n=1 Tax=Clostridium sp. KNHs214 TaxID=1540257 RepID=UPI00055743BD|nr:type II secretion system protein [Clostridium sp. KNHs214]
MKKAYTLIEILIVISLISLIYCGTMFTYRNFNKVKKNLDMNFYANNIVLFINKCKSYCKSNGVNGTIQRFEQENGLVFTYNSQRIDTLTLPSDIQIENINIEREKIEISSLGFTSSACTIKLNNCYEKKRVTIEVGTGYTKVKVD